MKEFTDLGQAIDCTEEEFRDFCKDKDLGYISSFYNLMSKTFNEVQKLKDELVIKLAHKPETERTEEEKSTLNGLYSKLIRIELRVFILRDMIKERTPLTSQVPI